MIGRTRLLIQASALSVIALATGGLALGTQASAAQSRSSLLRTIPRDVRLQPAAHVYRLSKRSEPPKGLTRSGPDLPQWKGAPPTVDSTRIATNNWSGYVAIGTGYTLAEGDWTVPSVVASQSTKDVSTWVGVGGGTSTTDSLIQVITLATTNSGRITYYAKVEVITRGVTVGNFPLTPARVPVRAGDHMMGLVEERALGIWRIYIEDVTEGWTVETTTIKMNFTSGSTAEWITERAEHTLTGRTLTTLADFGSVHFHHLLVNTGATQTALDASYMYATTGKLLAYPGPFSTATTGSFTDYYAATSAPPVTTAPPSVSLVIPRTGLSTGGTTCTITGTHLGHATSVRFGSTPATFRVTSTTTITATSPAGTGTVYVTVTTPTGTSTPTSGSSFTYITPKTSPTPTPSPPTSATATGYDLVGADGGVFVFDAPGQSGGFYGSLPGIHVVPSKPVVGMVATANDKGYFLVAQDGGVFSFGDAPFLGSLPGIGVTPAQPITGLVATGTDQGYFLVGRDGGVFTFGNAPFLGSLPGEGIHVDDIVGIAATPSGNGYWLVASTGQVYAFGAAKQLGTALGTPSAVSAIAGSPTGGGYWITTKNGAVYAFGTAKSFGTLPASHVTPSLPVVGIVHTAGTGGYWLLGADGGIFAFGDAPFYGSLPGIGVHVTDIVGAVPN